MPGAKPVAAPRNTCAARWPGVVHGYLSSFSCMDTSSHCISAPSALFNAQTLLHRLVPMRFEETVCFYG